MKAITTTSPQHASTKEAAWGVMPSMAVQSVSYEWLSFFRRLQRVGFVIG